MTTFIHNGVTINSAAVAADHMLSMRNQAEMQEFVTVYTETFIKQDRHTLLEAQVLAVHTLEYWLDKDSDKYAPKRALRLFHNTKEYLIVTREQIRQKITELESEIAALDAEIGS